MDLQPDQPDSDLQQNVSSEIYTPFDPTTTSQPEELENETTKDEPEKKNSKFYLYIIAGTIIAIIIALPVLFHFFQSHLIYRSYADTRLSLSSLELNSRDDFIGQNFKSKDDTKLHGYWIDAESKQIPFTLIYFQGNEGERSMDDRAIFISKLRKDGFDCNVFMPSYRGFGKSEGTPSEAGIKQDSQAALDFVIKKLEHKTKTLSKGKSKSKIVVYGQGLGAAVAIDLASRNPETVQYLILENAFLSIPKVIPSARPALYLFLPFVHELWDNERAIKRVKQKILFMIGEKDNEVPPEHSLQLHDLATQSAGKSIVRYIKGGHKTTWTEPGYFTAMKQFLSL